jgi:tRNA-intron endonuclease
MAGRLLKGRVVIPDEAEGSQIYNKGFYGTPLKGGGLELDLLEALYLLESDRLEVQNGEGMASYGDLVKAAAMDRPDFETQYFAYRDLRQRGYIVLSDGGEFDFRLYPRGGGPSTTQAKQWVMAVSERSAFKAAEIVRCSDLAERTRKELLIAVVDEEGDITFYSASCAQPKGDATDAGTKAVGILHGDSTLVLDEEGLTLQKNGYYGRQIGKMLKLSLIETAYLMETGRLTLQSSRTGKEITYAGLLKKASSMQGEFQLRLHTYRDLKSKGLVAKTGFKYGTHFRVYEGNPSLHHSKYLVHAVPEDFSTTWAEVSRAIRLAHGVKKEVLFASVGGGEVLYIRLRRVRP